MLPAITSNGGEDWSVKVAGEELTSGSHRSFDQVSALCLPYFSCVVDVGYCYTNFFFFKKNRYTNEEKNKVNWCNDKNIRIN